MPLRSRFYSIVTFAASLVITPALLTSERGRTRFWERLGWWQAIPNEVLWFHGASLGEVTGLLPLMAAVKERTSIPILLTSTSVTGLTKGADHADFLRVLPYDSTPWISGALRKVQPRLCIFSEKDIWPALIGQLLNADIPLYLVNGQRPRRDGFLERVREYFIRSELSQFRRIFVQSNRDGVYLRRLVGTAAVIEVVGNTKYSKTPPSGGRELKEELFGQSDLPVLVLGSLRPGEERFWFPELAKLLGEGRSFHTVVAPRHRERFEYFATALRENNLPFVRYSERVNPEETPPSVVLLDSYGQLERAYSFADLAFVGGTLVPEGGHNPFEAIQFGACTALGPHRQNIEDALVDVVESGGILSIQERTDVERALNLLVNERAQLHQIGAVALKVWAAESAAVTTIVERLHSDGVLA